MRSFLPPTPAQTSLQTFANILRRVELEAGINTVCVVTVEASGDVETEEVGAPSVEELAFTDICNYPQSAEIHSR